MSDTGGTPDHSDDPSLNTDRALSLLADSRRRRLLIELADRNPGAEICVDSATLERALRRTQRDHRSASIDVDRAIISMHHIHLPKLAECDVIAWNELEDTVEPGPAFEAIEPFIDYLDRNREDLPADWRPVWGTARSKGRE